MSTSSTTPHGDANNPLSSPSGRSVQLVIETPSPGVRLIRIGGVLGGEGAARLLRLVDSQLMLARSGQRRLRAVIIDMGAVEAVHRGGPEALSHIRYACDRRGIEVVLAGCLGPLSTSLSVRGRLRDFRNFPTAQAALHALEQSGSGREGDGGWSFGRGFTP